jgi:NAD+ synthase
MKKINRNLNLELIKDEIISWIKSYCEQNNIKSLIVGVSGGIDSALVSTLCAHTGIDTYTVLLPIYQNKEHTKRGENHIKWLKSNFKNVNEIKLDLSNIFDSFKKTIDVEYHNELSLANTKSRIRMTTLYHIAQSKNGIVVGTGNKVEDFGVGFFTKYGDGGVDISPIADLYKSEVYSMSELFGIIDEIITSQPTDGLWDDDRNDESQIGVSYDNLEYIMEYIKENPNYEEKMFDLPEEIVVSFKRYIELNSKNKHNMVSIPMYKIKWK